MSFESVNIGAALGAVGALGPASFALVDSLKILPNGGISNVGFASIARCVQAFFPNQTRGNATGGVKRLLDELHGNWISGRPLVDQKAMAKSLIELRLTGDTAAQFAQATDQDAVLLKVIGEKMTSGAGLEPAENNLLARFDLLLAAPRFAPWISVTTSVLPTCGWVSSWDSWPLRWRRSPRILPARWHH
jgi:hypothetical protein